MVRVSGRVWLGWSIGAGLGLALTAVGGAAESDEALAPAVGSPPAVSAAPPASSAITVVGKVRVRAAGALEGRLVQIVDAKTERELIVDEVGAGRALSKHVGESVSATGVVSRRKDGREVLLLSSFRPLGG